MRLVEPVQCDADIDLVLGLERGDDGGADHVGYFGEVGFDMLVPALIANESRPECFGFGFVVFVVADFTDFFDKLILERFVEFCKENVKIIILPFHRV